MTGREVDIIDEGQVPVKFEPPALETFLRYSSDLIPLDYDDIDERGKTVTKKWPLPEIKPHTKLIPEPACLAIIAELEAALVPADYKTARGFTNIVVGRGIQTQFNNLPVFISETTRLFSKYPADIGSMAVELLEKFKYGVPKTGNITAVADPLLEKRRGALRQARAHLAEHQRRAGKPVPKQKLSKQIERFKGLGPAIKEAVGAAPFKLFWGDQFWLVLDDGTRMVLAQPSLWLRDITLPHVASIGKVANRVVELVIRSKPAAGSCKAADGPRPIGDVLKGN